MGPSSGCISVRNCSDSGDDMAFTDLPMLRVWKQRSSGDCALVALAMYLGVSYEDALGEASQIADKPHRKGLFLDQIERAASALGVELKRKRKVDFDNDHGILVVTCKKNREFKDHVVVLRWGLLFDTECDVWEPDAFLEHYDAKPATLFTRSD